MTKNQRFNCTYSIAFILVSCIVATALFPRPSSAAYLNPVYFTPKKRTATQACMCFYNPIGTSEPDVYPAPSENNDQTSCEELNDEIEQWSEILEENEYGELVVIGHFIECYWTDVIEER